MAVARPTELCPHCDRQTETIRGRCPNCGRYKDADRDPMPAVAPVEGRSSASADSVWDALGDVVAFALWVAPIATLVVLGLVLGLDELIILAGVALVLTIAIKSQDWF